MSLDTTLSVMTCYYLRNFLRQNAETIKSVVAPGAGIFADSETDFHRVLASLYLDEDEIAMKVKQLETLTRCHQMMVDINTSPTQELIDLEKQILWILGLKRVNK